MLRRRTCCLALLLLGAALTGAAAEEAAAEGAAGAEATPTPDAAAAEAEPEETQIVLNCDDAELLEPLTTWSPDCVAQWAENMGYPQLKAAFLGNKLTGKGLEALSLETLEKEYGVADEHDRKTLAYTVKDMLRKDNYRGNTNDWRAAPPPTRRPHASLARPVRCRGEPVARTCAGRTSCCGSSQCSASASGCQ